MTKAPAEGKALVAEWHQFRAGKIAHVRQPSTDGLARPCSPALGARSVPKFRILAKDT
jgi:hypothetical protein